MRLIPCRRRSRPPTFAVDFRRLSVIGLALITLIASPTFALSVFDVIQLSKQDYGDQAIIDLIEATSSAFDLEAEDLPKLQRLGVSEPVIRAMLERAASEEWDSAEAEAAARPHQAGENNRTGADVAAAPHDDTLGVPTPALNSPFTAHPLREAREGGHVHLALALDGMELLVLRDEGEFASIETRGRAVVERLRKAWATGRGHFRPQHTASSGAQVVFRAEADEQPRPIRVLVVSAGDAHAYTLRSGRGVTPDLLAMYWADLLSDFWAVARGEPPGRLLALHEGGAIGVLYEALVRLDGQDATLGAAAELVPSSTRHHLERLAQVVPMEYGPGGTR